MIDALLSIGILSVPNLSNVYDLLLILQAVDDRITQLSQQF